MNEIGKTAVCHRCGIRRPYSGMVEISVVPEDIAVNDELMSFCGWECVRLYAQNEVSP